MPAVGGAASVPDIVTGAPLLGTAVGSPATTGWECAQLAFTAVTFALSPFDDGLVTVNEKEIGWLGSTFAVGVSCGVEICTAPHVNGFLTVIVTGVFWAENGKPPERL